MDILKVGNGTKWNEVPGFAILGTYSILIEEILILEIETLYNNFLDNMDIEEI